MGGGLMVGMCMGMPHHLERQSGIDPYKDSDKANCEKSNNHALHSCGVIFWQPLFLGVMDELFQEWTVP